MPSSKQAISEANSRLTKIEQFLLEHLPAYKDCPVFREWLEWADACSFLISVSDDDKVIAAAVVRPITLEQLEQPYDSYVSDAAGDILYIDAAAAPNKQSVRALGLAVLKRFGRRAGLAFNSRGKLKIHDHSTVAKALFKLKN